MKKIIALTSVAGLLVASQALASGYRIPEQSMSSTALSGAYVANAFGADASYYNPANMGWAGEGWQTDANLTFIRLSRTNYQDNRSPAMSGKAEEENFLVPQLHLVSPDISNARIGISVVSPAGLAKRWKNQYASLFSENFSLKVLEVSPSVSYTLADKYSIAAGFRLLKADAKAMSKGIHPLNGVYLSRFMEGDTIEYGYNVAISARATKNLTISATYRSNVDLELEGDATLGASLGTMSLGSYDAGGDVSIPVPGVATIAAAYTFGKTTVELAWDRTFWSEYEELDFNYDSALTPTLAASFDAPIAKDWEDSDAIRLGVSIQASDALTLMAAVAIDENPVPEENLNFETPDSDARLVSMGVRYVVDKELTIGASYLYDYKVDRYITNANVSGKFTDATAHMLSFGAQYTF